MEVLFQQIENPSWTGELKEIVSSESGSFDFSNTEDGSLLGQEWYRFYLQGSNETIGLGWLNVNADEVEISVVVNRQLRGEIKGIGSFIVSTLEQIILEKRIDNVIATVKGKNPYKFDVFKWFYKRGYTNHCQNEEDLLQYAKDVGVLDVTLYKKLA